MYGHLWYFHVIGVLVVLVIIFILKLGFNTALLGCYILMK